MTKWIRGCVRYFQYDMKMYHKFVLVYFVCTVVPFLLLSMTVIKIISGEMLGLEVKSARAALEQANTRLNSRLQNIIEETYSIYLDNELYEYLSSDTAEVKEYQTYLLENKLSTIVKGGRVSNAALYLADDSKISKQHYRCQSLESAKHMAWYQHLTASGRHSIWHFIGSSGYYVSSIYSKYDSKKLVGYIVMTFPKNVVSDILKDMCITENTEGFLQADDSEIAIFAKSNPDSEQTDAILATAPKSDGGDYFMVENPNTKESYFLLQGTVDNKQISGMPSWTLVIAVPYRELTHFTNKMTLILGLSVGFCLILSCILIAVMIRSITRRIDKLNWNMQRPQKGDFSVNDVAVGCDEISELRRNFNFMLNTVEQLLEEKVQAEEHRKDIELSMLQAQINPHFLYNTLDMINWAAISKIPEDIPVITGMLAKFYKMSLSSGAKIVRLADELEHVKLYIGLQNKRFGSVLTLKEEIPEELLDCACLKILLQPIVENAVLHGIFEKDIPEGVVTIRARYKAAAAETCGEAEVQAADGACGEAGIVTIEIEDDGVGMTAKQLERLRDGQQEIGKDGYGLSNIEERIRLCYGNDYGLRYESRKNEYTRVTIRIRYVKYEESLKLKMKL